MKKISLLLIAGALANAACAVLPTSVTEPIATEQQGEGLQLGQTAPMLDREMLGVDGQQHSIQSTMGDRGVLVVFSCNTCPFVVGNGEKSEGWEGRYTDLAMRLQSQGFGMILVNSNEAKREGDDSYKAMQARAELAAYAVPYVVDEQHVLADAFGAMKTPHVYLLDATGTLVYTGAIDDNVNRSSEVRERFVVNAVKDIVRGQPVSQPQTPAVGCSIKRVAS